MDLMRWITGIAVLFLLAPAWGPAQPQDSFLVDSYSSIQKPVVLYEVSPSGAVLATLATLPAGVMPFTLVMAEDNRSYRLLAYEQPTRTGFVLDVSPGGTLRTVISGRPLYRPVSMVRTCDGDWLLAHQGYSIYNLDFFRLQGSTLTSLCTVPGLYGYVTAVDEDTGLTVVRGMDRNSPSSCGYYNIDVRSGTVTSFAIFKSGVTSSVHYGAKEPIFEGSTGAFIDAYLDPLSSDTRMCRAHRVAGISDFSSTRFSWSPVDLTRAGQRTAGVGFYILGHTITAPLSYAIIRVKPDGSKVDVSSLKKFLPHQRTTLLRVGSRHLTWFLDTPPNGRSLHLSFPGEGGRIYMVGLSLAGVRPGIPLPVNRSIPLIPDELTVLCMKGGVEGMLENTVGILDSAGCARVTVNTNAFGKVLKGIKVWAAVVVIDTASPGAVACIAGPTLLVIS
jgi:hypothetical protein